MFQKWWLIYLITLNYAPNMVKLGWRYGLVAKSTGGLRRG